MEHSENHKSAEIQIKASEEEINAIKTALFFNEFNNHAHTEQELERNGNIVLFHELVDLFLLTEYRGKKTIKSNIDAAQILAFALNVENPTLSDEETLIRKNLAGRFLQQVIAAELDIPPDLL